jgi:hypothetical protein
MDIQTILNLGIVGAFASIFISYLKAKYRTNGNKTKLIAIIASLLVALGYSYLENSGYMEAFLGVLASATVIYDYFLKEN